MSRYRNRFLITAVLAIVISSMLAGCGGGMLGTVLKITGARALLPDEWASTGNVIKILADISGSGIKKVIAYIKKLGDDDPQPLILVEVKPGTFEGEFQTDRSDDSTQPAEYSITVEASDTAGNQATSEPLSVEVPPADSSASPAP